MSVTAATFDADAAETCAMDWTQSVEEVIVVVSFWRSSIGSGIGK